MTPLSLQDLRAPYEYVVVESHIRDVQRLLRDARDDEQSTSVTLGSLSRASSILALGGLGREIWRGVDPLAYVEELRNERGTR